LLQRNQTKGERGKESKMKDEKRYKRRSRRGEGKIMQASRAERLVHLV
jgi:hypothetical protein